MINNLPADIFIYIYKYIALDTIYNLSIVCKNLNHCFRTNHNYLIKLKFIIENYHPILIDIFSLENMITFPILTWKSRFLGIDYIDGIKPHDLVYPIMLGTDNYNRSFISVKTFSKNKNKLGVDTIFRRYSNDMSSWTDGGDKNIVRYPRYIIDNNLLMDTLLADNIKYLFENKPLKFHTMTHIEEPYYYDNLVLCH